MSSPIVINIFYVVVLILFFIMIYWWWGIIPTITALAIFIVIMFTVAILAINAKYAIETKVNEMKEETEKKFKEIKDRVVSTTNNITEKVDGVISLVKGKVKDTAKERFFG